MQIEEANYQLSAMTKSVPLQTTRSSQLAARSLCQSFDGFGTKIVCIPSPEVIASAYAISLTSNENVFLDAGFHFYQSSIQYRYMYTYIV